MFALIFQLVFLVVFVVTGILFLKTIQNVIKAIKPENRTIEPLDVWYMLIPLVNYYYYFVMVNRVAHSIKNENESRGANIASHPPHTAGLIAATSLVANFALQTLETLELITGTGLISFLITIIGLICWIIYWVQVSASKRKLSFPVAHLPL